ncbi:sensor histidine kinase [Butyrivibrio sp. MC2013]|uniref:sensor histidine kinase n=1 Tax=Butyrivibrio sp. MC2013 TaxID=1280686 RepID=UPI00040BA616|nr:sensor histidine kinase [Butyrivibrio sp. MC2013]
MDKIRSSVLFNKLKNNIAPYTFALMILIVFMILFFSEKNAGPRSEKMSLRTITEGWVEVFDNDEHLPVNIPGNVKTVDNGYVIENVLPVNITAGSWLAIPNNRHDMKIYVDDKLRREYVIHPGENGLGARTSPDSYVFAKLYINDSGRKVRIEGVSDSLLAGEVGEVMLGSQTGIWVYLLHENLKVFMTTLITFVMSLIIFVASLAAAVNKRDNPTIFLATGIFLIAIWRMCRGYTDNTFMQLVIPDLTGARNLSNIIAGFISFPFLIFSNRLTEYRYNKIHRIGCVLTIVVGLSMSLLHYLNIAYFSYTLPLTVIPVTYTMIVIFYSTASDIRLGYFERYKILGYGMLLFFFCAMMEIVGYFIPFMSFTRGMYGFGIVFLITSVVGSMVYDLVKLTHDRQISEQVRRLKTDYLSLMSRGVKSPVNKIMASADIIEREMEGASNNEYVNIIRDRVRDLTDLIDNMQDYCKLESGELLINEDNYFTRELFNDCIYSASKRAENKGISYKCMLDRNLPSILRGDENNIRQLFQAIFMNALTNTRDGKVEMSVSQKNLGALFYLIISVKGPENDSPQSFFSSMEKGYEETDDERTELGHIIAKRLAEAMGGRLQFESGKGKASMINAVIPQKVVDKSPIM